MGAEIARPEWSYFFKFAYRIGRAITRYNYVVSTLLLTSLWEVSYCPKVYSYSEPFSRTAHLLNEPNRVTR